MKKILVALTVAIGFLAPVFYPANIMAADDKNMDAIIKKYIETHPEVLVEAIQKYYAKQRKKDAKSKIEDSFQNRVTLPLGGAPSAGPEKAEVVLVEFSDFQCPFCARVSGTLHNLRDKYKGKLRVVFKHLPLPFHKKAPGAAKASLAANEQGKFWPYRDLLMSRQAEWGAGNENELFIKYAKELELDITRFKKDVNKKEFQKIIDKDMALAKKLGISGTPTFFLNGVRLGGAQPQSAFENIIDKLIAENKSKS